MLDKDSLPLGIILGLIVPFIGFAVWKMFFESFTDMGMMDSTGMSENWRDRTTALLAICMNIIPFTVYNKKRFYNTMRGLVFPTMLFCMIWFYYYGKQLAGM